jgi:hypothetical protein
VLQWLAESWQRSSGLAFPIGDETRRERRVVLRDIVELGRLVAEIEIAADEIDADPLWCGALAAGNSRAEQFPAAQWRISARWRRIGAGESFVCAVLLPEVDEADEGSSSAIPCPRATRRSAW